MKRPLSVILILAMVVSLLAGLAITANAATYSGTCGENLTWTLDSETGVLEITGTGEMKNWLANAPWYSYRNSIKSVSIDGGVTSIGRNAFSDCTELTSMTISEGVTSIGRFAFSGCTGLTSVMIPDSITSVGHGVFMGCTGLKSITVDTGNAYFCSMDSVLYNQNKTTLICYPAEKEEATFVIPDSVISIDYYAFYGCTGLTSVTIPDGVKFIESYAFCGCTGLTNMTIPDSVISIGASAFSGCTGLMSVTIPDSVTSIESHAFYDCTRLTSVTIPGSVTSIGYYAFCGCTGLTSVTIPDSVTSIGTFAFYDCSALTSITIGIGVTNIQSYAFDHCNKLTDVYYCGTESGWNNIFIGDSNNTLTSATRHCLAEGLRINTASLTLYEDIAVNFTASVPEGLTDPYMLIEINGQSYTVTPNREDAQGRLVFEFMNLTPDMMGDNIKATLYATAAEGQLVHYCKPEYSVRQYCTNVMAAYPENAKLQTLLADMLVYGAATQMFTGHNADILVTAGLTLSPSEFIDLTATDFTRTGMTDENIQWTGAGLECGSQMSMYFILNTMVGTATSVEVSINGRTTVYNYSDMTIIDESDFGASCRVTFRGIAASEYGDVVTAVLKNNGTPVGQTLTYSVNSYIYAKQDDNTVENLAQLVQALYNYGASAKSYLN